MIKRILLSIVLLLVLAYLIVAVTAFNRKPAGQVCRDVELVIKDTVYAGFITKKGSSRHARKERRQSHRQALGPYPHQNVGAGALQASAHRRSGMLQEPSGKLCIESNPAQSLLSVRRTQVANYPLRIPVLLSVNGTELQFNVRQCIYGNRHEAGQLSNATLGNWSMLGYFIGGIATIWLSVKGVHFKLSFAAGFLFLGLSAMFMYFEVQGAGLYERMKYPVIIRSTGMMFLYSLIPTFATQRMPYKYLSSWICTMLTVRMVLAPSIGTALYSNVLQERQQHYITRYAQNVDMMHPEASASFMQTVQGMQYQGKSKQEAVNMAATSTKGRIQVQATLSAVKEMAGWTLYACLFCMIFVVVLPYLTEIINLALFSKQEP